MGNVIMLGIHDVPISLVLLSMQCTHTYRAHIPCTPTGSLGEVSADCL